MTDHTEITATIGADKYITRINTTNNTQIVADEPEENGGQNKGPNPGELLAAALGACACITMRMYADRKAWPMESVAVIVTYEQDRENKISHLRKEVVIKGELDEQQKQRITTIGDKCPIHHTLTHPIEIETVLK